MHRPCPGKAVFIYLFFFFFFFVRNIHISVFEDTLELHETIVRNLLNNILFNILIQKWEKVFSTCAPIED